MTDPTPLTDDELAEMTAQYAGVWESVAVTKILRLLATVEQMRRGRDETSEMLRNILVQISDALGLPLTEAGRPRANSFLYREIGRFIECHDWDWPPEVADFDAIRRAQATPDIAPNAEYQIPVVVESIEHPVPGARDSTEDPDV